MDKENNSDEASKTRLSIGLGPNKEGSTASVSRNENGKFVGPSNTIFQNGTRWLRVDFHLHTMKDKEFSYNGDEKEFPGKYIARMKEEGINIGIITNHNKFDLEEYNMLREEAGDDTWIVAGTELSVSDGANGIHCLIVFDEYSWIYNNEKKDYINEFLTVAFSGKENRENENARCNYDLKSLFKALDENRRKGRDSFIVLAHVQQESGFFKELDGGRIQEISRNSLFIEYVVGMQKLKLEEQKGKYKNWFGRELPASVEGSDCKSLEQVGKGDKKTYVKIGDFNFTALKYALLDHENRVKTKLPIPKNSYIKSIHFEGGKLSGQTVSLSPGLNSFIGIRGSGKSAILEAIRYVLNITLPDSSASIKYKNELIPYILGSGCKITLFVVDKHKGEYRIERVFRAKERICDVNGAIKDCSIKAILDTPVYFGQGDLSHKTDYFEYDLVNRFIGNQLTGIREQIEIKNQDIKDLVAGIRNLRGMTTRKEDISTSIKNDEQKLSYYEGKGVEEKLRKKTQIDSDIVTLRKNKDTLEEYLNRLHKMIQNYQTFFSGNITELGLDSDIIEEANAIFRKAKFEFENLKSTYKQTLYSSEEYERFILKLEEKDKRMQDEFAEIKRELNLEGLDSDEFLSLRRSIKTSYLELQEIKELEKSEKKLQESLQQEISALEELREKEYKALKKEAKKISDLNRDLEVEVIFKGGKNKLLDKLKSAFKSPLIRDSVCKNIADKYNGKDFIDIYKDRSNWKNILDINQLGDFSKQFDDKLEDLLTYKIDDEVIIKYKNKPLDNHSLGQRASALILFLLARKDTDILIIDQPEDDLDSQTIYIEVIKELLRLKGQMQFIFATHNANIPVLGDSEKVVACRSDDTKRILLEQGTIDTPEIQNSIIKIMEGGEEAFSKRREIYRLWKPKKNPER